MPLSTTSYLGRDKGRSLLSVHRLISLDVIISRNQLNGQGAEADKKKKSFKLATICPLLTTLNKSAS